MSPRILEVSRCPHCKVALSRPPPRVCPQCGGSLQKRYLSAGCLSSAPVWFVLLGIGWTMLASAEPRAPGPHAVVRPPDASASPRARSTPPARGMRPEPLESVAIEPGRP